jgi:YidC/Oxa1 family membrane protein insertase
MQKMQEELAKLRKEGYNPTGGCLPLILTMVVLFGVLDVVYKPMTYFERVPRSEIAIVRDIAMDIEAERLLDTVVAERAERAANSREAAETNQDSEIEITIIEEFTDEQVQAEKEKLLNDLRRRHYVPLRAELRAIGVFKDNPQLFSELAPETVVKLERLSERIVFVGIDFSKIPYWNWNDETRSDPYFPLILIPILSFIFSVGQTLIMQRIQKKNSPETVEQMGSMKYMFYFMPFLSLMIAFQFPAGAGFYWSISALIGIIQSLIIFKMYPPEKLKAEVMATLEKQGYKGEKVVVIEKYDNKTSEVVSTSKKVSEMTAKEQKEYYRKKLEQARKDDLEKYGEIEKNAEND